MSLVVVTSPTYDGIISDIAEIANAVHEAGVPLLVDEAHGAHLDLSPYFVGGAVKAGADLVVQSLHKTMPSLTQTAIAHVCSERIDTCRFADALSTFETSSPSYLLMSSMDECINYMQDPVFKRWNHAIAENKYKFSSLVKLRVFGYGNTPAEQKWKQDPSKILVSTRFCNLTGPQLATLLREQYNIEVEMAAAQYILSMTGPGDTSETIGALAQALYEIDQICEMREPDLYMPPPMLERVCGVYAAKRGRRGNVVRSSAAGKISGEYIYAYPPGIPLVVPGERLDESLLQYMESLTVQGVTLHSDTGDAPEVFSVLSMG